MTEPIDLLDEATWLWETDPPDNRSLGYGLPLQVRTVGDLRHLIALARDAERLRAALVGVADFTLGIDGTYCYCDEDDDGHSDDCTAARAALEGTDR